MLNSVRRTGQDAVLAPDEQRERRLAGAISSVPDRWPGRCSTGAGRWSDRRSSPAPPAGERCRAATVVGLSSGNSSWSVASISASSLIVSTGGPFSRSASSRSPLSVTRALHLQRAGERVGVVLQRDDPTNREVSDRSGRCRPSGSVVSRGTMSSRHETVVPLVTISLRRVTRHRDRHAPRRSNMSRPPREDSRSVRT